MLKKINSTSLQQMMKHMFDQCPQKKSCFNLRAFCSFQMNSIVTSSIVKNIGVGKAPSYMERAIDYNSHITNTKSRRPRELKDLNGWKGNLGQNMLKLHSILELTNENGNVEKENLVKALKMATKIINHPL